VKYLVMLELQADGKEIPALLAAAQQLEVYFLDNAASLKFGMRHVRKSVTFGVNSIFLYHESKSNIFS